MADEVSVEYGELANGSEAGGIPGGVGSTSTPGFPSPYTQEHAAAPYDEFLTDTTYITDSGLRVLPKAGTSTNNTILNSVVQIHRGTCTKEVRWTAQRYNKKPKLPNWRTGDPNEVPITQSMTLCNVAEAGALGKLYRVSGVYTYALLKPKDPTSKFPIGTTPAEVAPSSTRFYDYTDFSSSIIDAAFAARGGLPPEIPIRIGV